MTATSQVTQVPLWRKLLAGAAGLAGAINLAVEEGDVYDVMPFIIPVAGPAIAALLVHRSSLGPQLLARAIWWSNLGLGAFLCFSGSSREGRCGVVMVLGYGVALLVIGRKSLAEAIERAAFIPAAFKGSLLLLMVLALADMQSLGLFAILVRDRASEAVVPLALAAAAFAVGFIGLYRLAVWGALVNLATAVILFTAVAKGALQLPGELAALILMLTLVQMLVATPMLIALVRGKPLPAPPPRVRAFLAPLAIGVVMIVSVSFGLTHFRW